jgi:hypothetical protein
MITTRSYGPYRNLYPHGGDGAEKTDGGQPFFSTMNPPEDQPGCGVPKPRGSSVRICLTRARVARQRACRRCMRNAVPLLLQCVNVVLRGVSSPVIVSSSGRFSGPGFHGLAEQHGQRAPVLSVATRT